MENEKITYKQLVQLLIISRIISAITTVPALSAPPRNQDRWIAELLSFPILILLSLPVYYLWKKYPKLSIIQYSKVLLGKSGILIGFLIVWFFMHNTALTLALLGEFLNSAVMQETPRLFFIVTMVIFSMYAVYKGLEVLGRSSEFISPIIIISIISIVLFLMKDMKLTGLTPVLEKGILPVLYGSLDTASRFIEILALAMILPNLNDDKKVKRVFISFFSISILLFILITTTILLVWGVKQAKNTAYPFFSIIKVINIGNFLQRIDAIHMAIWILGNYIRISFYFYLSVLGISQIFNFKNYKFCIIPVGTLLIPLSILIAPSFSELREFSSYKVYIPYSLFYIFFIPALLLAIAVIKKRGEKYK